MAGDTETLKELHSVLTSEEINSLSDDIRSKVDRVLISKTSSLDSLKANNERLKINSEQRYEQLEKQLIAAHNRLETEATSFQDVKKKNEDLEIRLQKSADELEEFKGQSAGSAASYQELARSTAQLEGEKNDLVSVVERKTKQLDQLQAEWNSMSEKRASANAAKTQMQLRVDELENDDVSLKYREKRLHQEVQGLTSQNAFIQAELEKKTKEVLTLRKEKSNQILQLQSQLNDKSDECKHAQQASDNFRKVNQDQAGRIEHLSGRVKEGLDVITKNEEQFQAELQAQSKLSDLYKRASEEAESRVEELITAVEELRGLLKQATDATNELEAKMREQETGHAAAEKEMADRISKLQRELEDANDLIAAARQRGAAPMSDEELSNLCPTAAAASTFIKSGMTLTEIYSQYVKTSDELLLEKQENQRLNMYMDQILAEIEEKAPILQKQREDYEQALETVSQLSSKLEAAMLEGEQLRIVADDAERRVSHLGRDNQRFKQKNLDLGQQVRVLLKEVGEARGGPIQPPSELDISSSDISSSSQVISDTLVSFRSLEELQSQNERLIGVVRDLSEKQEKEESETLQTKTAELKQHLEEAVEELEEMRSARSRQTEMVESIVRQRDMYRVLLAQTGSSPPPLSMSSFASPTTKSPQEKRPLVTTASQKSPGFQLPSDNETKKAFETLQTEFDTYRKEKGENEKMLNKQLEKLRKEVSDFRVQNTKLSSQLEFNDERYKVLQSNVDGYKKEIAAITDKNQKFSSQVVTLQQTASSLTQDLLAAQEKVNKAEIDAKNLRDEKAMLKEVEIRLTQEKESMIREHRSQALLLTNLQQIQNNLERSEFESKTRMTNQLEGMERELTLVRRRLGGETDQHKTALKSWMGKVHDLQQQLNSELSSHQRTRNDLTKTRNDLQGSRQQTATVEAQLVAAKVKLEAAVKEKSEAVATLEKTDGGVTSVSETELKEVNNKLRMAENQIRILREQVKKLQEQRAHYQSISKSVEQSMKEQNQASDTFKSTMEKRVQEITQDRDALEKEVTDLRKDKEEKESENKELHVAVQSQTSELRRNLTQIQEELKEALARRKDAEAKELTARQDSQQQAKVAKEMQDKYEREFLLHAADMKQLITVKEQLTTHNSKLTEVEETAKKAQTALDSSEASWKEQLRIQKEEAEQNSKRSKELEEQNKMLHQQLEALSNKMLKQSSHAKDFTEQSVTLREEDKSAEQLLGVIKFLRREKELSESRFELAQTETLRLKYKIGHTENQLEQAQRSLSGERERAQVLVQSSAQHQDLMKKVQSLNVVTDSNRLLREEKERVEQQLQQLVAKVTELEGAILPLQEQNRSVEAERDALSAMKTALTNEVGRWKQRTNQLIEKSNRTDPEEYKKLLAERDQNKKVLSEKTEEIMRHKADVSRLNAQLGSMRAEISKLNMAMSTSQAERNVEETKLKADIASIQAGLSAKQDEIVNKDKTINQVKKIGRRYKAQYEEVKGQLDQLQEEVAKEKTATPQPDPEMEAKVSSLEDEVNRQKEEITQLKTAQETAKTQLAEKEEKEEKSKKLMLSVRQKINNLSGDKEKLTAENSRLKSQMDELKGELQATQGLMGQQDRVTASQKAEQEARIHELERELEESRQTLQRALEEQQHQEQVREIQTMSDQSDQAMLSQPGTSTSSDRQSTSREEAPPTANIRPMASPASSVGQSKGTSSQSTAKVTASIRPIAVTRIQTGVLPTFITTTMATPTTMVTPMATVMPQTVADTGPEQEDSNNQPFQQDNPVAPMATATPIQAVQPTQQTPPTQQAPPIQQTPPTQQTPPMAAAERRTAAAAEQEAVGQNSHRDDDTGASGGQTGQTGGSTSPGSAASKRPREDPSDSDTTTSDREVQPPNEKRQRVAPQPQVSRDEPEEREDEKDEKPEQTETAATETAPPTQTEAQTDTTQGDTQGDTHGDTPQDIEAAETQPVGSSQSLETAETQPLESLATVQPRIQEVPPTEQQAPPTQQQAAPTPERHDEETGESKPDDVVIVVDSDDDTGGVDVSEDQADPDGEDEDDVEGEDDEEDDDEEEDFEGDIGEEDGEDDDAFEEGQEDDVDVEYDDEDDEGEEEMDDDEEEEDEEEMEDAGEDAGEIMEDDVVEIIDDDEQGGEPSSQMDTQASDAPPSEAPQPMEAQVLRVPPPQLRVVPPDPAPTSTSQESSSHAPLLPRLGMRTERLGSHGRLPPFSLMPSSGVPFEDFNDDGQVPSTPTLFVPHRGTDGFAEAINSPLLPTRFQFEGDSRSSAPGLAQLVTQGDLGMDDTRINLMVGEDEASGRSVPTTPLQTTAPVSLLAGPPMPSEGAAESSQSVPATRMGLTPPPSGGDEPDTDPSQAKPASSESSVSSSLPSSTGQSESGPSAEDKPGPSGGDVAGSEGRSEPSSSATSEGESRQPKPIKRIVWSDNTASHPPGQQPPSQGGEQRPRNVAHRGGSRGRILHRNVAYRGRGRGGPRVQQWK